MSNKTVNNNVIFLNPETMNEEKGKFVKAVDLFKMQIKSELSGISYIVDVDDVWSVG